MGLVPTGVKELNLWIQYGRVALVYSSCAAIFWWLRHTAGCIQRLYFRREVVE
jgi:hypothetical protein